MSVRGATAPVGWLGCLPLLRPFALLLASYGGVPSGSLLRVQRQVFAMGSPFRVEPVSILDCNVDSPSTFLVLVGVFAMGSPCRVDFVSGLDRNEDSLRIFPCGRVASGRGLRTATGLGLAALVLGVTGLDPRIDTGLAGTALGVIGRVLRTAPGCVRIPPPRSRDRSRSRGRRPSLSARLRSEWTGQAFRDSKASSVHLSFVASRWGHPAGRVCFLTFDRNEVLLWVADRDSFRMGSPLSDLDLPI